jgi:hypothetical protein
VDEVDACETDIEGPIRLAERRTLSFANRKIEIGSSRSRGSVACLEKAPPTSAYSRCRVRGAFT